MEQQEHFYTDERNAQIVIALLKAHGIRQVVASPGTTHASFLGSIQYDPWFRIWSAVDERHASYMAVGIAAETGEPVVLTCTGATASRNYFSALTEAYYRKLPILALTSSQLASHVGNMYSQALDRSQAPKDAVRYSVACPPVENDRQARECELAMNKALLELRRRGGGPVHINLESAYSGSFRTKELPKVHKVERFFVDDDLPEIPADAKVAVFVCNHRPFTPKESAALERFLATHNAVVACEATSSWYGSKRIVCSLLCAQAYRGGPQYADLKPDLVIMIGAACNDYPMLMYFIGPNAMVSSPTSGGCGIAPVWYVNADGEARDRFDALDKVFEMPESHFFSRYAEGTGSDDYYRVWAEADGKVRAMMPELPFSNLWMARETLPQLPKGATLHLGVSTTLQSWTAFLQGTDVRTVCNVGGCGIDGCVSTLIGASVARPDKLFFGVVGDLTFFYDMNSIANRHVGNNLRLLVVNNGCGGQFHTPGHILDQFTDRIDDYMAAGGHFGNKSKVLLKHYAEDLGFTYLTASTKEEFKANLPGYLAEKSDRPVIFECFTDVLADREAWGLRMTVDKSNLK